MRRVMKKQRALTVRRYAACLIDINDYFASFLGVTLNDKISVTELNKILLNSMPNSWYRQNYVQGFDCEYINFKKAAYMFERMEIAEYIYGGIV